MKCGLLGQKLGHSFSPRIHQNLGDYAYDLYEKEPQELEMFLRTGDFHGLNVTIPYKKAVISHLDALSPVAARLGAVNTIVRRDGVLLGHNTDYFGFRSLVSHFGIDPAGKKCLVLGSGGASAVVVAVMQELGAEVVVISRSGQNHYGNLERHRDAAILVNTSPVGMYPNNGQTPVDLGAFPNLQGVIDLIYNPARTQLLLDAQASGIPCCNGLWMLVAQAKEAAEWFTGATMDDAVIAQIHASLCREMENVVLIGMPGCGKTTIGNQLAQRLGKEFADSDALVEELAQKSIPRIFAEDGEAVFRDWETQALDILGKRTGLVIATGGGCVTMARNEPLLRQNGRILWLQQDLEKLATAGRPLSQSQDLRHMYETRAPLYAKFADEIIPPGCFPTEQKEELA